MSGHYGVLTQQFYNSTEERDAAERREGIKRMGGREAEKQELIRRIGADNYRRLKEIEEAEASSAEENSQSIAQFLNNWPEFRDTPENAARISIALRALGYEPGQPIPYEVLEETAQRLAGSNMLELDQKVIAAKDKAAADAAREAEFENRSAADMREDLQESRPFDPLSPPDSMIDGGSQWAHVRRKA